MKKFPIILRTVIAVIMVIGCSNSPPAREAAGIPPSLQQAIDDSARNILEKINPDSRVAFVSFESPNTNLSNFIMEEITGVLFEKGIEIADRQNMDYVLGEIFLHMSGEVDDDTARSVGKFLLADYIITGSMTVEGNTYRYRTTAIRLENAEYAGVTNLELANDRAMQTMARAMAAQRNVNRTSQFGVTEETVPETVGVFMDRGLLFTIRGDYDRGIEDFTSALAVNPNLSSILHMRSKALIASAAKRASVGDELSDVTVSIFVHDEMTAEQARIFDRAIDDLSHGIQLDPGDFWAYGGRAMAYVLKGDYNMAIADYTEAIRLNSRNAKLYQGRGMSYRGIDDNDRALEDFTQAIRLAPDYATAYFNRGGTYHLKGDHNRAIEDYTQSIRLNPNFWESYFNRGLVYWDKRDYNRVIADFTQFIQHNRYYAPAYVWRARAYGEQNKYREAIADCEGALRYDPDNTYARELLTWCRQKLNQR